MAKANTISSPPVEPATQKDERRAAVRLQSSARGSCQSLSMQREADWEAFVRDISSSGIGLLLPRRFEPGALLSIELPEAGEGRKRLLLARVARSVPQPDGGWLIGCVLASPLSDDELQLLLGHVG